MAADRGRRSGPLSLRMMSRADFITPAIAAPGWAPAPTATAPPASTPCHLAPLPRHPAIPLVGHNRGCRTRGEARPNIPLPLAGLPSAPTHVYWRYGCPLHASPGAYLAFIHAYIIVTGSRPRKQRSLSTSWFRHLPPTGWSRRWNGAGVIGRTHGEGRSIRLMLSPTLLPAPEGVWGQHPRRSLPPCRVDSGRRHGRARQGGRVPFHGPRPRRGRLGLGGRGAFRSLHACSAI